MRLFAVLARIMAGLARITPSSFFFVLLFEVELVAVFGVRRRNAAGSGIGHKRVSTVWIPPGTILTSVTALFYT
jgi:hypothetical protein